MTERSVISSVVVYFEAVEKVEMKIETALEDCLGMLALSEKPNCELVELYRWNDHGVDHIVFMGLDGYRYRCSNQNGQNTHWEVCPHVVSVS